VRDVLNLLPLARSLGYVDMHNVFMPGWSRGGMMTYLALKHHIPGNAVAWAEQIRVPVLILHGGADWRSDPRSQALAFAQKMQELGKTYELILYAADDHVVLRRWARARRQRASRLACGGDAASDLKQCGDVILSSATSLRPHRSSCPLQSRF
jgi:dipeptidyl aminopeptidase/acylaminoacyl peptidase